MRVMFNEDWIHFFWTRYENNIDVTERRRIDTVIKSRFQLLPLPSRKQIMMPGLILQHGQKKGLLILFAQSKDGKPLRQIYRSNFGNQSSETFRLLLDSRFW